MSKKAEQTIVSAITIAGDGTPYTQVFEPGCFGQEFVSLEYEILNFRWTKDGNGKDVKTIKKAKLLNTSIYYHY